MFNLIDEKIDEKMDEKMNELIFANVKEPGFKEYDGIGIIFGVNNKNEYYVFYIRKDRPLLDEILHGDNLIFLNKKDNIKLIKNKEIIKLIEEINNFINTNILLIPPYFKSKFKINKFCINDKIEKVNFNTQFLGAYMIEDLTICDDLIYYYNCQKKNNNTNPGNVHSNGKNKINLNIKHSFDTTISLCNNDTNLNQISKNYLGYLKNILNVYMNEYPASDLVSNFCLDKQVNIQYYPKNGGYKTYHTERNSSVPYNMVTRHLVFMTYLNDVTDRGETEFFNQRIKVKPKKGLTLIWPVDWTFYHRGIPSPTQEKYIITGWYNFTSES